MSANLKVASRYLAEAEAAMKDGRTEEAAVWAQMAMVPVATDQGINIRDAINRLADIVNNGRTWH